MGKENGEHKMRRMRGMVWKNGQTSLVERALSLSSLFPYEEEKRKEEDERITKGAKVSNPQNLTLSPINSNPKANWNSRAHRNPNRQYHVTQKKLGAKRDIWPVGRPGSPVVRPAICQVRAPDFSHDLKMMRCYTDEGMVSI